MNGLAASRFGGEERDGRLARATIWTICLGMAGFFAWASVTPVHEIVSGRGHVRSEGGTTRVEHLQGGQVEVVGVAEGDVVSEGDVLLRLAGDDLRAERRKVLGRLETLDAEIVRHRALLRLDLAAGDDLRAGRILEGLDPTVAEEVGYRLAQIDAIRAQRTVAVARRDALVGRERKLGEELGLLARQARRYADLAASRTFARQEMENRERELIRVERALVELQGEGAVLAATVTQSDAREAELVASSRREAALLLGEREEERSAAAQALAQIEGRLARTVLPAPIGGVVSRVAVRGPGEVIGSGEVAVEIVPSGARLLAEVEVPADRIGGVAPGQAASLKVLTYDFTRFGELPARVERVSPSSYPDEEDRRVFRLVLAIEDEAAGGAPGPRLPLTPGMTVVADIRSDSRSILSYLLSPVQVLADRSFVEP